MRTYILFIFGSFEDHQDIEYFCMEVLGSSNNVISLKYVIDNLKNIIVIFDTSIDEQKIKKEISDLLNNENVAFYFMFKKEDLILSYIPESMKNLIFKPTDDIIRIEVSTLNKQSVFNLDDILDKIETYGIDSLTPEEKNFLDNFNL